MKTDFYIKLNVNTKISLNTIVFIDIIPFLSVTVENYNSLQKWIYHFWEKEWSSVICVSFVKPLSTSDTYADPLCMCRILSVGKGILSEWKQPSNSKFLCASFVKCSSEEKKVGLISVWLLVKGKGFDKINIW